MKERILKILASHGPMLITHLTGMLNVQSTDAPFRRTLTSLVGARLVNVWPSAVAECIEVTRWGRNVAGRRKQ